MFVFPPHVPLSPDPPQSLLTVSPHMFTFVYT